MISLSTLLDAWSKFFFEPESSSTLAIVRIAVGLICLLNGFCHLSVAHELFGPDSMVPWDVHQKRVGRHRFSLLTWMAPTHRSVLVVMWLQIICAAMFAMGLGTRFACIGLYVTMTSIHHRNMDAFDASDTVIRLFVFLLCFAPCGVALSVDAWLVRGTIDDFPLVRPTAFRLLQVQVSLIYVQSVRLKLQGKAWKDGTASWYPLQLERFVRSQFPRRIFGNRNVLKLLTWSVLAVELAVGTLIWVSELRLPMIALGLVLHSGFGFFLQLRLFGVVMAAGLLSFVPADLTKQLLSYVI